jgi:hypothetical protein
VRTNWLIVLAFVICAPAVQATPERENHAGQPQPYTEPDLSVRDDRVFDDSFGGMLYPHGPGNEGQEVDIPVGDKLVRRVRLFDRQIAYRNDRKACITFELPVRRPQAVKAINMDLDAYNDDSQYLRAIWFEVDGVGGYLGVSRIAKSQVRGGGTIGPKERKSWRLSLDRFPVLIDDKTLPEFDFASWLLDGEPHTVCSWISTYAQYGPNSWITLDLEIVLKTE